MEMELAPDLFRISESIDETEKDARERGELVIPRIEAELIQNTTSRNRHEANETRVVVICPNMFQEILKSSNKWKAPVKPVLLMTGGLPRSGKSHAIRQLLQLHESDVPVNKGFTHYDVLSVGGSLLKPEDPYMTHHFGFLAGIRTNFNDELQQVEKFTDDELSASLSDEYIPHYLSLKHSWELLKEKSHIESMFHSRSLKRGAGLVKIWDTAFDSFSSQFLYCFSGHFYNCYMWLFTDVDCDLNLPPSKDDTMQPARRLTIQYLLNPSKLSSKLHDKREHVCTIFVKHNTNTIDQEVISKLQNECNSIAPQLKCSDLINKKIIPISFCDDESSKKSIRHSLRKELQSAVSIAPQGILLSHMFLRGSLELEPSVFMRREDLRRKAGFCGINHECFDDFCRSFTSFGSIIDVGLVSTSNIIIIRPDEFLSTLDQAFYLEKNKNIQVARDGILTSGVALSLLGKDYQFYMEVLEAVGLATPVAGGECKPPQIDGDRCYYIPSLRLNEEELQFNPEAVQMIRSPRYPSINMEVALTKHLLKSLPNPQLELTGKKNVTKVTSSVGEITITYHGEAIDFLVSSDHQPVIKEVIKACKEISLGLGNRSGEAKFHFATICKKHNKYLVGHSYYRRRHVLERFTECIDCGYCVVTENIQTWSSLLSEPKCEIPEKIRLNGGLTVQDASRLIQEISTYDHDHVQFFIRALNQDRKLPEKDKLKWPWILMEVIGWWMMQLESHKVSTKKEMAIILLELYLICSKNNDKEPKFDKLARELDIQVLSLLQVKSLNPEQKQILDDLSDIYYHLHHERSNLLYNRPSLDDLTKLLHEMASQYNDIGTALKVPMESIKLTNDYQDNLKQTLAWWIDSGYSDGLPVTWRNIINVIKEINYEVAEKMEIFIQQ